MKYLHYIVLNNNGEIIADGEGRPQRAAALKKAIDGKLNSYAHAATVKVLLERALGNQPEIIEFEYDTKIDAQNAEKRSHTLNGRPSANAAERYEKRLQQLGWKHSELDGYARCFIKNILKHGDNISTSRADFNDLKTEPIAWQQIKTILGV